MLCEKAGADMAGFIEGVDREQIALFPDRLEDWVGEDHPVRVVDAFVDALDLAEAGFRAHVGGEDGAARLSSGGAAEALHLRLPEPCRLEPAPGTGGGAQRRGHVADGTACAGPQDDRRFPARTTARRSARPAPASSSSAAGSGSCGGDCVAIDGSKFKAVNHRDRNFTTGKVKAQDRPSGGERRPVSRRRWTGSTGRRRIEVRRDEGRPDRGEAGPHPAGGAPSGGHRAPVGRRRRTGRSP